MVLIVSGQFELDNLRKDFNRVNKEVARLKIVSFFLLLLSFQIFY